MADDIDEKDQQDLNLIENQEINEQEEAQNVIEKEKQIIGEEEEEEEEDEKEDKQKEDEEEEEEEEEGFSDEEGSTVGEKQLDQIKDEEEEGPDEESVEDEEHTDIKEEDIENDDELREYIEVFNIFDQDRDGALTADELQLCLQAFDNIKITTTEFESFLEENAMDESGPFSREIYLKLIEKFGKEPRNEKEELRDAFRFFDSEERGYLTKEELQFILCSIGLKMSEKLANRLIKETTSATDNALYYEEFIGKLFN